MPVYGCWLTLLDDACRSLPGCAGIVNYLPMWLAPNLITLLGTMGLVLGYIASAIYLPEFEGAHIYLTALHRQTKMQRIAMIDNDSRGVSIECDFITVLQASRRHGCTSSAALRCWRTCTWIAWMASRRAAPRAPRPLASCLTTVRPAPLPSCLQG